MKKNIIVSIVLFLCVNGLNSQPDSSQINLSDVQKERIKLEEIYRSEINIAIKKNENKPSLDINSPFIIWLLSSVVLAFISFYWKQLEQKREKVKSNAERQIKIILELAFIIKRYKQFILKNVKFDSGSLVNFSEPYFDRFFHPVVDYEKINPIFPDFKDREFDSLLYEINFIANEKYSAEENEIRASLTTIRNSLIELYALRKEGEKTNEDSFNKLTQNNLLQSIDIIEKLIIQIKMKMK